jgi:hypothetical protein
MAKVVKYFDYLKNHKETYIIVNCSGFQVPFKAKARNMTSAEMRDAHGIEDDPTTNEEAWEESCRIMSTIWEIYDIPEVVAIVGELSDNGIGMFYWNGGEENWKSEGSIAWNPCLYIDEDNISDSDFNKLERLVEKYDKRAYAPYRDSIGYAFLENGKHPVYSKSPMQGKGRTSILSKVNG